MYIDFNINKEFGFEAHIYHIKINNSLLLKAFIQTKSFAITFFTIIKTFKQKFM